MPYDPINISTTPNDGNGDPLRTGGVKINQMLHELYEAVPAVLFEGYQENAIGTIRNDLDGTYARIDVDLDSPIQQGVDYFIRDNVSGDLIAITPTETAGPGKVSVDIEDQKITAVAGSYIVRMRAQDEVQQSEFNERLKEINDLNLGELDTELEYLNDVKIPELEGELDDLNQVQLPGLQDQLDDLEDNQLPALDDRIKDLNENKLPGLQDQLDDKLDDLPGEIKETRIGDNEISVRTLQVNSIFSNQTVSDTLIANNAFINELVARTLFTDELVANNGFINSLVTREFFTDSLVADNGFINELVARTLFTDELVANDAFINDLAARNLFANKLVANQTFTDSLTANAAFIDSLIANTAFIEDLFSQNATISARLNMGATGEITNDSGDYILDEDGYRMRADTGNPNKLRWINGLLDDGSNNANLIFDLYAYHDSTDNINRAILRAQGVPPVDSEIWLTADRISVFAELEMNSWAYHSKSTAIVSGDGERDIAVNGQRVYVSVGTGNSYIVKANGLPNNGKSMTVGFINTSTTKDLVWRDESNAGTTGANIRTFATEDVIFSRGSVMYAEWDGAGTLYIQMDRGN